MKTAGLVLDFYDDSTGEILKSVCPTPDSLPESVKVAHILSPEEREVLRDDAFALILHNNGKQLRKFACVDEGNTVLSTIYFMENSHKMPEQAVKVAAANLAAFNEAFGLPVPYQVKLAAASGMARRRNSDMTPAVVGDEADWAARTNILSVRGGADSGRVIPTANQMKTASISKEAISIQTAAKGLSLRAIQGGAKPAAADRYTRVLKKHVLGGGDLAPIKRGMDAALRRTAPAPSAAHLQYGLLGDASGRTVTASVVDVSGLEAAPVVMQKQSSRTALNGMYSLDSYSDVQEAVQYFADSWTEMAPEDRREFSVKTASRAEELGIEVPELMQRYGSNEYSPDVDAHLANRRQMAPQFSIVWNELQEKRAMIEPEIFAELLKDADELCGLNYEYGGAVFDPFYATFGGQHETEKLAWAYEDADGTKLTEESLRSIPKEEVEKNFAPDFAEAFAQDPITIFDSMPVTTKQVLARMVR